MGDMGQTMGGQTLLLVVCVAVIAGGYLLASWAAARLVGGEWTAARVAAHFAHTLARSPPSCTQSRTT